MSNIKKILKSWVDDKPVCNRSIGDISETKFECLYEGNDMVLGRLHFPGVNNCESCCGLLFKFETSIFRRNIVQVVLVELPENMGTSVTQMCEEIAQYVHNKMLAHYPVNSIMWYEHYVRTEESNYPIDIWETFFDVHNIEELFYYRNPNWKKCEDEGFLKEIIATVSKVLNVKYSERREDEFFVKISK